MKTIPEETLTAIQQHFHAVIREWAGKLIDRHNLELPPLTSDEQKCWFPVPDMYGGFRDWWEREVEQAVLISESWCRVVQGSGQRHGITASGSRLIDQGFV